MKTCETDDRIGPDGADTPDEQRACPMSSDEDIPSCSVGPIGRLIWLVRDITRELRCLTSRRRGRRGAGRTGESDAN